MGLLLYPLSMVLLYRTIHTLSIIYTHIFIKFLTQIKKSPLRYKC
nr:MAG TPA: hypothetical protein [Caudoviricetes sp.]